MAKPTQYATIVPDAGDWAALAQYLQALEQRVTALEDAVTGGTPETVTPSPDGATTDEPLVVLVDDALQQWRLTEARSVQSRQGSGAWAAAGVSYDVALIMKWQATCYQQNNSGHWYAWTGDTWQRSSDPSKPPPEPARGAYSVRDGQIIDSNGARFIADGFCLLDRNAKEAVRGPDCKPLLDHYPSCNYIHLMPWGWTWYTWPQDLADVTEWLTAKGIVVEIGNWQTWPSVPTGDILTQACAWYRDLATRYKDNPRVWFSCCNEPQDWYVGLPAGSITQEHLAVYDTIRGTGNNTLIGICGTACYTAEGLDFNAYGHMTGVHWDSHFYPWMSGPSGDYNTCANAVYGVANDLQRIRSADGLIPCLFGEVGNATDGAHVDDPGGVNVQACLDISRRDYCGIGIFCCPYWPADTGGQPNADQVADEWAGGGLTPYGKQVQASFAQGRPAASAQTVAQAATAASDIPRAAELRAALRAAVEKWRSEHT